MDAALEVDGTVDLTLGADERVIRRGFTVTRIAGGALLLVALLHGASLLQAALFGAQTFPLVLVEATFAFLCVTHVLVGARVYDASPAFAAVGAGAALGGAGFAFLWFAWLLFSGVLGLLPLLVVAGGTLAGLACLAAFPIALKVQAARRRLFDV